LLKNFFLKNSDNIFVFLASFCVYFITLCPTVYVGDSGELTAAALTMGIAHPPGYPLYIILAKLFSILVPFGNTAFEINLFSAVCASLTVMIMNILLKSIGIKTIIAVCSALSFGFINVFWSQATVARVYTLNSFLMISALYFLIRYNSSQKIKDLMLYFFFAGLGLANHLVSVITIPAAIFIVFSRKNPELLKPPVVLKCLSCLVPGLIMYTYLPLRSKFNPVINWGNPGSQTGKGLLEFILRKEYWNRAYVENFQDVIEVVGYYLNLIPKEFFYFGTIIIVFGIIASFKKSWRISMVLLIVFLLNIFFMIIHASRSDIFYWPRYVISAFMSVGIWFAFGLNFIFSSKKISKLSFLSLLFPITLAITNFYGNDRSNNYLALDFNKNILEDLPENSTLMAQGDNVLFPITYLHYVEKERPDIKLFEVGMNQLKPYSFNPEKTPTFFTHYNDLKAPKLKLVPYGLVYRASTIDMNIDFVDAPSRFKLRNLTGEKTYFDYLCRCLAGDYYFMLAVNIHRKSFDDALPFYKKASETACDNDVTQYNLGLVYSREGLYPYAIEQFEKVLKIDRKNINASAYIESFQKRIQQIMGTIPDQYSDADIQFIKYMDQAEKSFLRGDAQSALVDLKKVLELKPQAVQVLNNLGTVYIIMGDLDNAYATYQEILKINSTNMVAGKNILWLENLKPELSELTKYADDSERENNYKSLLMKSAESFKSGRPHESVFYLKSALKLKPESIDCLRDIAAVYISLKQYVEAIKICDSILAINPDDKDAQKSKTRLEEIVGPGSY